ncbi:hypothetical protein N9917_04090 [Deltaproteobacteria bacterium]|nr:hypothetical protein [Deltaproteobacteria bacterium]
MEIRSVRAVDIFNKNMEFQGFQYVAIMENGEEIIIRKKATRLYKNAFHYEQAGWSPGKGLAQHMTFGQKPNNFYGKGGKITILPIQSN